MDIEIPDRIRFWGPKRKTETSDYKYTRQEQSELCFTCAVKAVIAGDKVTTDLTSDVSSCDRCVS